jgi:putative nucleotidyltransferase with HDIG domain
LAQKHRILVIGRTGEGLSGIGNALSTKEYDLVQALSQERVQEEMASRKPSVAIVDLDFRPNDAYTLCESLSGQGVAVIALQRFPSSDSVIHALRHGAIDLLVPPVKPKTISSRVHRALIKIGKVRPASDEKRRPSFLNKSVDVHKRLEYTINSASELLALPHAVSAVLKQCAKPGSSATDLVGPIESDSAIAASTFRYANSVAQASRHRVTDLKNAIARLGTKAVTSLVMAQAVFDLFDRESDTFGFDRTKYWIHSLGSACCARTLAVAMEAPCDPDEAFLAGLLHDIGKMVFDEYLPVEFQQAVLKGHTNGIPIRKAEREVFGRSHAYVGEEIAKRWGLPERICHAIADHHNYERLAAESDTGGQDKATVALALCTCMGNHLAKAFGFGHAVDFFVEEEALSLWSTIDQNAVDPITMYRDVSEQSREFLDLLELSADELGLQFAEPGLNPVLLCLPEEAKCYQVLLEAFFARLGNTTMTRATLDDIPEGGVPFVLGVTTAAGSRADLKKAAAKLGQRVPAWILLSDSPDVGRDGLALSRNVTAVRRELDFYNLASHIGTASVH